MTRQLPFRFRGMSLHYSAAHSSRITKPKPKNPLSRTAKSSIFTDHVRKNTALPTRPGKSANGDASIATILDDTSYALVSASSLVQELHEEYVPKSLASHIEHISDNMFDPIPDPSGLNSTRTADIMNFVAGTPPIVSLGHLLAVRDSATSTERDLAHLVRDGIVRRLRIPGRGQGSGAIGDGLILVEEWERIVQCTKGLSEGTQVKYLTYLKNEPESATISATRFNPLEKEALIKAGLLTTASTLLSRPTNTSLNATASNSLNSISAAGSQAAAGSIDAVGGAGAFLSAGGGGGYPEESVDTTGHLAFSLPSTGPYLRLVEAGRKHLLSVIRTNNNDHMALDLLRELWDGDGGLTSGRKGSRPAPLPSKTRKWKKLNGLKFSWIVEEAIGAGLVEAFETNSVGLGLRII